MSDQYSTKNFLLQLIANGLTKLGDALVDVKTVLPWVMQSIGVPVWMVSALVPLRESGSLLPQRWWTGWIKRQRQRKRVWLLGCLGQFMAVVVIAAIVATVTHALAGILILVALSFFSLARSLCSISSKDVLGRTIPKTRRGQLTGWSASIAGVITLVVGGALWLQGKPDTTLYLLLLLSAAMMWLLAACIYNGIDEPQAGGDDESENKNKRMASLSLLWRDSAFGWFMLTRSLLLATTLVAPFYTLLIQEASPQLSQLGLLMIASSVAAMLSGPIWGRLADWSSRWVLVASGVIVGVNGLFLVTIYSQASTISGQWLTLFFFALMFAYQGVRLGRKTYIVDMADGDQRTDFVALGNTFIGVILLICALFGTVAQLFSVVAVIISLSIMSLVAGLLALKLPEVEVLAEDA